MIPLHLHDLFEYRNIEFYIANLSDIKVYIHTLEYVIYIYKMSEVKCQTYL